MPETIIQNRLFLYEPHIVQQIAQLITYDEKDIPIDIQTYALHALEAVARHKSKASEVLSTLNASANHGILVHILRQLVKPASAYTSDFYGAFFNLISFLLQTPAGQTMLMTAGIISTLVQLLDQANHLSTVNEKVLHHVLSLLDTILTTIDTAYPSFFNANGIHVITDTIQVIVEKRLQLHRAHNEDQVSKYNYLHLIKLNFRLLMHLMDPSYTTATTDGLRNLMDTTNIGQSIITISQHLPVFGPSIFAQAINFTTLFIHSEPTSLSALQQELKLPQAILKAFNSYYCSDETIKDSPPSYSHEVLVAAINSFGAFCLNETGLTILNELDSLNYFFKLLTSPPFVNHYVYELTNSAATNIGVMMDELTRHQPKLKEQVHQLIENELLRKVIEVGSQTEEDSYSSRPMDHSDRLVLKPTPLKKEKPQCLTLGYVDLVAKFLEGFLRNTSNTERWSTYGKLILQFYELPNLPYDFVITSAFDSLSFVFRVLSDANPLQLAGLIASKIYESSQFIFKDFQKGKSTIHEVIEANGQNNVSIEKGNKLFRKCSILFGYTGLLSSVFASSILTSSDHSEELIAWCLKKVFISEDDKEGERKTFVQVLGEIHRTMVWQNILLRNSVPESWYTTILEDKDDEEKPRDPRLVNTRRFKLLIGEIPPAIMPIFQGIIKASTKAPVRFSDSDLNAQRALEVGLEMTVFFKECLQYLNDLKLEYRYNFYASIFSMISMLLLNDRSSTAIHMPIAIALRLEGVLDLMLNTLFPQFWTQMNLLVNDGKSESTLCKRVNTCIELLLAILNHLGSAKTIHFSVQVNSITLKDGIYEKFEPFQWIAAVHLEVCCALSPYVLTQSSGIHKLSKHVLQSLLRCLTLHFKSDGEQRYPRRRNNNEENDEQGLISSIDSSSPDFIANRTALIGMGFESHLVENALSRFQYGLCALDYLFSRRLVEHPVSAGRPILSNISSSNLVTSTPLTAAERNATRRILVNLWYNTSAIETVLADIETEVIPLNEGERRNLLYQLITRLDSMDPVPSHHGAERQENIPQTAEPEEEIMEDDNDENYEDIDTDVETDESGSGEEEMVSLESKELFDDLSSMRREMRENLPQQLASLVNVRNDVDLEIRDLMVVLCCGDPANIEDNTKRTIHLFSQGHQYENETVPAASFEDKRAVFEATINRIRIFALMMHEPSETAMHQVMPLIMSALSDYIDWFDFLNIIVTYREFANPHWLTTLFSVLETKLAFSDPPTDESVTDATIVSNEASRVDSTKKSPVISNENRTTLLKYCIDLLKLDKLTQDNFIATLRIIVRLTKHYDTAQLFMKWDGLNLLFEQSKQNAERLKMVQLYIVLILRHLMESKDVIKERMREWLPYWFSLVKTEFHTVSTFIRSNGFLALRDPEIFLDVSSQLARLTQYPDGKVSIKFNQSNEDAAHTVKDASNKAAKGSSVLVMKFLLQQLNESDNNDENILSIAYRGFLLKLVFELVSSYPSCKYDIFESSSQNRDSVVYKMITQFLPYDATTPFSDDSKKQTLKQHVSTWAYSIIVSMCYDTTRLVNHEYAVKEDQSAHVAITRIRKHVLDLIIRAFKETLQSNGSLRHKYSHYIALSELSHRLLFAHYTPLIPGSVIEPEAISQMCELMIEKKFVSLLISVIEDVDVNYPHAKSVLNSILVPLEQLTKLAIRLDPTALNAENKEQQSNIGDEYDEAFIPMDTDDDDSPLADVNDIYRNSSLAMMDGTVTDEEEIDAASEDSDVEMASSGQEIIDDTSSSDESDDDGELEEDEEMEDLMRSHRYHQSDTEDEEEEDIDESSDEDESSSTSGSESGISIAPSSVYDSSEGSSAASITSLDEVRDLARNLGARIGTEEVHRRGHFRTRRVQMVEDNPIEERGGDISGSDSEAEEDVLEEDLNEEEMTNVARNLGSYLGGITRINAFGLSHAHGSRSRENNMLLHPIVRNAMGEDETENQSASGHRMLPVTSSSHLQAYEDIIGFSAVQILEELIQEQRHHQQRQHQQQGRSNTNTSSNINADTSSSSDETAEKETRHALAIVKDFSIVQTVDRWSQEFMMVFMIPVATEKAVKLSKDLTERLKDTIEIESESKDENAKLYGTSLYLPVNLDENTGSTATTANEASMREATVGDEDAMAYEMSEEEDDEEAEDEEEEGEEEPVTIMIDGEEVDITGTGIDVEFLRAIPENLRAEVLSQTAMEYQSMMDDMDDDISPEFLDALPQDLRAEISEQLSSRHISDIDATNTIEATTAQQEPQTEPVETSVHSDEQLSRDAGTNRRAILHRNAIRLVEHSELLSLVKLLFVPHSLSKTLLNRLLLSLCENSKTRDDLLSLLLCQLQDASEDSFTSGGDITDEDVAKQATKSNLIIQRCLEIAYYVVTWNDRSIGFFLANKEVWNRKRRLSTNNRKWKSRLCHETPILFLLGLLDRKAFVNNTFLMEQLTNFLMTICRYYPKLVRKYNKLRDQKPTSDGQKQSQHHAPEIPKDYLQKIVNVFCNGECSSHTFQYTVSILSYLSSPDGVLIWIIDALTAVANICGGEVLSDLKQLAAVLEQLKEGTELTGSVLVQFSAATSHQARLLRILKAMDYLYTHKRHMTSDETEQNQQNLVKLYNKLDFAPVWRMLSGCLKAIQGREDLLNVATVLLPLVESFMAVSKYSIVNGNSMKAREATTAEQFFLSFTEEHKKLLNIMVRNNPSLMNGAFSLLVKNPKILEFDNKRSYFNQQLHKRSEEENFHNPIRLNVRRDHVFEDTYRQLQGFTGDEIRYGKLNVQFDNEDGTDAGGLSREWFQVLARQMFDPNYALFITSAADKLTYQPNRASGINPEHLSYFKFVGRVIGKAIHDGRLLDAYFTRSFYKLMLERPVDYRDLEASLVWMLENDITDIMDLTFSIETDDFGTTKTIDLKPNGREISVTEENKHEYVTLVTEHKLVLAIKDQVNAFLQGFHDIIPRDLIQIFNEQELELLISGLPDIDIEDWKANTEYEGYTLSSPQIQWFWRAVRSFDQEERAKLLQFSTEGFAKLQGSNGIQKFQIHKEFGTHTCFNQIDLPQYESYDILRTQLFKAISECSTGFGFE
ncbi:hypothetical protein BDF20DRAFT_875679 [Mycotypha africana]|uniref:uncharacterized protein n=1 Tax=Mycotypha africana TaxID=64632 RepID=UPI002301F156|nr:uncharacterized protein BDF20DRAFT_875679 [Mycotypha africana]KAI8977596.1 hypothetical protein BDF20DRAFT_875679 [Mycotypha africana]